MVDPALLRRAADRGVTICFADLDGADGLWVPEERTVLVSRRLSEREVAEVIEHELTHVAIDDQHADLDAGRDVVIGHPVRSGRSRVLATALSASALFAVLGGISLGLARTTADPIRQEQVVAPTAGRSGLTAQESGAGRPQVTTTPSRGPDGRIVVITITLTATPTMPAGSITVEPSTTPAPSTTTVLTRSPENAVPRATGQTSPAATVAQPSPTTVAPTTTTAPTTETPVESSPVPDPGVDESDSIGDGADTDGSVPGTGGEAS